MDLHSAAERSDQMPPHSSFELLVVVLGLGLAFEFVNGFHDAANAIATVVATRVLRPPVAVAMAGVLNFVGAVTGTAVAATVGKGLVDPHAITQRSEEHTSELQSRENLVCRLLLEKKNKHNRRTARARSVNKLKLL